MQILHIITGLNNGGAEGALFRLATTCKANSHHVVSLMDGGVYGPRLTAAGIPVSTLDMPRRRLTFRGMVKLHRLVRSVDPDVVQTWLYHSDFIGGMAARLAGKPAVWGIRNTMLHRSQAAASTRWILSLCARTSAWLPSAIVSCSVAAARQHEAIGYPREKMVVVPNGFDLSRLAPDPAARARSRADFGVAPGIPLVGMVARWDPQKDHAGLGAALARLEGDWQCLLVGSGVTDSNTALVELLEHHGIRSRCHLAGPRSDIPEIMNALDLHVLSSQYGEAFPNVVAEAMACGTPCVATDVGDAALIAGETGWIVPPKDTPSLSAALREALLELADTESWDRRRHAARARIVANFDISRMVRGYQDVWAAAAALAAK